MAKKSVKAKNDVFNTSLIFSNKMKQSDNKIRRTRINVTPGMASNAEYMYCISSAIIGYRQIHVASRMLATYPGKFHDRRSVPSGNKRLLAFNVDPNRLA